MDEAQAVEIELEPTRHGPRRIIHIDMDAFFASVEQRDNPELRGRPVAVGGSRERGVVAAASYEARMFGVRSAMPSVTARRKCPDLIFVKPRFEVYKSVSDQIREIFARHTALIEPLSLDEAYLDVTETLQGTALASDLAKRIRQEIWDATGLTASAGISYNKFLAKMASDQRKPNGQFVIAPGRGEAFVEALPVAKFHGVGPATAERLHRLDIRTGADLKQQSLAFLQQHFGKSGAYFHAIARAIDDRPVRANRIRKSLGAERTFSTDVDKIEDARDAMIPVIDKVARYCTERGICGYTLTLKVKYADFEQITRSRTLAMLIRHRHQIEEEAFALLDPIFPTARPIRLLGICLSSLAWDSEDKDEAAAGQMMLAI